MIFWLIIIFVLYLIWTLLFSGLLWRLILFFGGWVGVYVLLKVYIPDSAHIAVTVANMTFSWAAVVPTVICLLALFHTEA